MERGQIRALTSVRFFAAIWVVLFHIRVAYADVLYLDFPHLMPRIDPLLRSGYRGVDLFFLLSGFILTLNYVDQLGPRWSAAGTGRYLWSRIARIWPLYMLCVLLGGLVMIVLRYGFATGDVRKLSTTNFIQQFLMIQTWFPRSPREVSWNGPLWSVSAEWLAYLLLPFLALLVYRLRATCRSRSLLGLAYAALLPLIMLTVPSEAVENNHWLARIMCEFVAGAFACAAITGLRLTQRQRAVAGWSTIGLALAAAGWLYFSYAIDELWIDVAMPLFFLPLLCCLAVGIGPVIRLMSTNALVVGGGLSYALYAIHIPLLHLYRGMSGPNGFAHPGPIGQFYGELTVVPAIVVLAWVLFRKVEEPARRRMRGMLDPEPAPAPRERALQAA
jgi:peptidoglycan/LPS O-acetylase OafA/YrhL